MNKNPRTPGLLLSVIPVLVLILGLVVNIALFKDEATTGPNQLALLLTGFLVMGIGVFYLKLNYKEMEETVLGAIKHSLQAVLILLLVGSLIGLWIMSGIVPTMIYYGLIIIRPEIFLPVACLVCAVVSLATGSSWSTTGTIGIALIAIGKTLAIPEGMVAGAIVSGAYFGDKMSPLSDTTNLAAAMAEVDLFEHIKHMMFTTVPAYLLALVGFVALGLFYKGDVVSSQDIEVVLTTMKANFNIGPHLFIFPLIVVVLIAKKVPSVPALVVGILLGGLGVVLFQQELLTKLNGGEVSFPMAYKSIVKTAATGFSMESGNAFVDKLFNRGGMSGMLSTIWLIFTAMIFGGAMEATGMLHVLAQSVLRMVRGTGSLIGATLASCVVLNMTASDQYLAIVVPGRMFKKAYDKFGLHPKNLSRSLEDAGTVTSPLIPWNSCGAYESGVMGVATLTYLPFAFFNILSPLMSAALASFDVTIARATANQEDLAQA